MTADDAKRLADDARHNIPSLVAAFDLVRERIVKRLANTPVDQQATILGEHAKLHLLMELDQAISEIIANGDHAALTDSLPGQ